MMRLTLPFVSGIAFSMWWPKDLPTVTGILLFQTVAILPVVMVRSSRRARWMRGPMIYGWCFVFGMFWQVLRDPQAHPLHVKEDGGRERVRTMRLTAINGVTEKVLRADADVLAVTDEKGTWPRIGKVMVTLMRRPGSMDPVRGDELVIRSRLEEVARIPDPGGFDRRAWAASRGMYHETFAGPGSWAIVGHQGSWTDLFEGSRQRVSDWLEESGLAHRERALVKALVLGLRDELDGEQRSAFVRSGTIHVLAVSGTHVGFIYAMLLFMFGWWGGRSWARIGRGVFILIALWGYAGLTGACPSVLRATIMFSLFTVAGMTARRADPLNNLFSAALLLLLWDPHMLVEIGFQLSFLAVLGIILFHGPLERQWVPNNRWVGYLWTLTVMSISAQLLTTPLSIYLFRAFPVWFLPANLIVVTAAGFAVYGSVALLAVHRIPLIGPLLVYLLTMLLTIVDRVTAFFASLPGAYPAIRIGPVDMLLMYGLVAFLAIWSMWRWRPALRLALLSVALLLIGWAVRSGDAQRRLTFTVYDDRKALQAALTVGRRHVVLYKDATDTTDSWLMEKVERQQRAHGLGRPSFLSMEELHGRVLRSVGPTCAVAGIWSAPGLQVRFITGSIDARASGGPPSDVLVIHDVRYLSARELDLLATGTSRVVLAGGLAWRTRSFVRRWCLERGIPCHDVRDQGAFHLEGRIG